MPRQRSPEPPLVTLQRASASAHSDSSSDSADDDVYTVEAVLKQRVGAHGDYEYLVKWEGYSGDEATTWEPEENLNCGTLLQEFKAEEMRKKEKKEGKERQELNKEDKASTSLEIGSSSEEDSPRPKPSPKQNKTKGKAKAGDQLSKNPRATPSGSPAVAKPDASKSASKASTSSTSAASVPSSTKRPRKDSPPPERMPKSKKRATSLALDLSSDSEDADAVSPPKRLTSNSGNSKWPVSSSSATTQNRQSPSSAPALTPHHTRPRFMESAPGKLHGFPSFRKVVADPKPKDSPPEAAEVGVAAGPYTTRRSPNTPHRNPLPSISDSRHPNGSSMNGHPSVDRESSGPHARSTSRAFGMPGSSDKPSNYSSREPPSRTPGSVIIRLRTGNDAEVAAILEEEVIRKVKQLKQEEAKERANDRVKQKAIVSSRVSDLEGRLRGTKLYSKHRLLFEEKTTAVACAELMGMDPALVLSMRNRYCTFIQAPSSNSEHEAEHVALGLVLLAMGAESPPSILDIHVVFIHRAASFEKVYPLLIDLFTSDHFVQLFSFGDDQPVAPMFLQGYLIMPTLSALRQADQLAVFSRFLARISTSTIKVHPASIVLGHAVLPHSWGTIAKTIAAEIVPPQELPNTSKLAHCATDLILSRNDPSRKLPKISIDDELDEIEVYLTRLRPAHPERHRRYVVVVDREGQDELKKRLRDVGVEVMSWSGLTASMKDTIY